MYITFNKKVMWSHFYNDLIISEAVLYHFYDKVFVFNQFSSSVDLEQSISLLDRKIVDFKKYIFYVSFTSQ